jgi:cytochrome c-type biogenesis protein CcmH/NrfG
MSKKKPYEAALDQIEDDLNTQRHEAVVAGANALLSKHPEVQRAWTLRGKAMEAMGQQDAAVRNFQSAMRQAAKHPRPRYELGMLYLRAGQMHKAERSLREALSLDPAFVHAYQALLSVATLDPAGPEARHIQAVAEDAGKGLSDRVHACFVLGRLYLQAGQLDTGFRWFETGNQMQFANPGDRSTEYKLSRSIFTTDRGFYRQTPRSAPATPSLPAVFLVGLPRAGKSLMEHLLCSQPSVMAGGELPLFGRFIRSFPSDLSVPDLCATLRGMQDSALARAYAEVAATSRRQPVTHVTDTMPSNIAKLGYLAQLHPETPVVLCSRDRMDLGLSMYFKDFKNGHLYTYDQGTLGRALARCEAMMAYWQRELPNPVIEVRYEDLVRDPVATTTRVIAHLGLPLDAEALAQRAAPRTHAQNMFVSRSDGYAGIDPSGVGYARPFAQWLGPMEDAYQAERAVLDRRLGLSANA